MAKVGWMIAVSRCKHLEADEANPRMVVFAVNLVRPETDALPTPEVESVRGEYGQLFYPWRWDSVRWHAWGHSVDGNGIPKWVKVTEVHRAPAGSALANDDVLALRDEIEAEIENTGCRFPFSTAIEHFFGKRSLAHSLAHLTMWPELISQQVLCLSLFLEVEEAKLAGLDQLVFFPAFDCDRAAGEGVHHEPGDEPDPLSVPQSDKPLASIGYPRPGGDLRFQCFAASIDEPGLPVVNLELMQGHVSRAALNDELYEHLLPAHVLRHWLEPIQETESSDELRTDLEAQANGSLREAFRTSLWQLLGDGRDIGRNAVDSDPDNHVLELLVPSEELSAQTKLKEALKGFDLNKVDEPWSQLTAVIKALADGEPSGIWLSVLKSMQLTLEAAPKSFTTAWLQVAQALLDPQHARQLYGPWLGTVLKQRLEGDPDLKGVAYQLAKADRIGLAHWMRGRLSALSQAQWEAAYALASELLAGKAASDVTASRRTTLEQATVNQVREHLKGSDGNTTAFDQLMDIGLEEKVQAQVNAWLQIGEDRVKRELGADSRRLMDRGLRLRFGVADPGEPPPDANRLRGYAIALCAGVHVDGGTGARWWPDTEYAMWLTDTAAQYLRAEATGGKELDWLNLASGSLAWMHETVGATDSEGESVIELEYAGQPLASGVTNPDGQLTYDQQDGLPAPARDLDGVKAVNFAWHLSDRKVPLLGFGLCYQGVATAIDNAGGIVDEECRGQRTQLKPARELRPFCDSNFGPQKQYRCNEAPGVPRLAEPVPESLQELSDETLAYAYQRSRIRRGEAEEGKVNPEKVALLAVNKGDENDLFPQAKTDVTLKFHPPGATADFIQRWLNTDCVLLRIAENAGAHHEVLKQQLSDRLLQQTTAEELQGFITKVCAASAKVAQETRDFHPAVSALGVKIWSPVMTPEEEAACTVIVPIQQLDVADGVLSVADVAMYEVKLRVTATAGRDGTGAMQRPKLERKQDGELVIEVPQGAFACVQLYALVDKRFFESGWHPAGRYAANVPVGYLTAEDGKRYAHFSPKELWFETLPAWNETLVAANAKLTLVGPVEVKGTVQHANELTALMDFTAQADAWAAWLKGVHIERHEWHWTGYPLRFPAVGDDLGAWQRIMVGTQTYRASEGVSFDSHVSEDGAWTLDSDGGNRPLVLRHALPTGRRPARYAAVLVRPIIRFRRWMQGQQPAAARRVAALEQRLWGRGCFVLGRGGMRQAQRLSVPALKQVIPLTATYDPDNPTQRKANGVMLVLDEALRRTDDLALTGGLGETVEVDVLDTRVKEYAELGVNPLMHANLGTDELLALGIESLPPFGLSFDIGRNPKVAQTGMIIVPKGAGGRWMMANVRVRRAILPEADLDGWIAASDRGYELAHRQQGAEWVPPDLAIDLPDATGMTLMLYYGGKEPAKLVLPAAIDTKVTTRYVLSWHRDRWGEAGEATWRCQVLVQQSLTPNERSLDWTTVGKLGCMQHLVSRLEPGVASTKSDLTGLPSNDGVAVRRIRLSDYGESRWVPFIGSFGQASPVAAHDLALAVVPGAPMEFKTLRAGVTQPTLRGLQEGLPKADDADSIGEPCFDLVLVSRSSGDLTRSDRQDGGPLVTVIWMQSGSLTPMEDYPLPAQGLAGCTAQVIRLQRITSLSNKESQRLRDIHRFDQLLEEIFPTKPDRECLVRFLPEHLGPLEIVVA